MCRNLASFLEAARHAFRFLVDEMGFREEELPPGEGLNPCQVWYSDGRTRIVVAGVDWGFGATAWVGPLEGGGAELPVLLRERVPRAAARYEEAKGCFAQVRLLGELLQEYRCELLELEPLTRR